MNEELWGWENRISQDISNQYIITNKKNDGKSCTLRRTFHETLYLTTPHAPSTTPTSTPRRRR